MNRLPIKYAYALAWAGIPDTKVMVKAVNETEFTMHDDTKVTKGEILI